ncbi:MAG: class II D-tagatose-bisphosphate aldolase, non-catalytic subunit, partial [Calditrichia bacterium]
MTHIIDRHKAGEPIGIPSICSANGQVIEAALLLAKEKGYPVLIESTSNQVDQFGGYTGMTPARFVDFVNKIADRIDLNHRQIIFGGDHLGPNSWQNEPAETA